MGKKTIKTILFIFIILIFLIPMEVYAENSFNLLVSANKTYVNAGQTVDLTWKVANINVEEPGINTVEGFLEYDKNIFEEVEQENIQSSNNWSITYNSEDTEQNGKFLGVILQDGVTKDQEIGKITLKVKSGVKYTKTTIKIKQIASNNGQELIQEEDKEIVLEVGKRSTTPSKIDDDEENEIDNSEIGDNKEQEENMSTGKLPQTGVIQRVWVATGTVLTIFAVAIYVRYKKIDN